VSLPELFTVAQVAAAFHKRPAAVRAAANRGEIGFHRVGRTMLFSEADVAGFLEKSRRPARGESSDGIVADGTRGGTGRLQRAG